MGNKLKLRRKFENILYELLSRDLLQPRRIFRSETIRELADNIRENDLFQPISVRIDPEDPKRYKIVDGERRWLAIGLIRQETPLEWNVVPCIVIHVLSGVWKIRHSQIIANLHREDLNSMDEAESYADLRKEGMTFREIHELTGKAVLTIENRLKLIGLPEEIKQMIRDDRLKKIGAALRLAQYRNIPNRQLIQLAYKLIHGERPLELEEAAFERRKTYRDRIRKESLPGSPEDILRQILNSVGGHGATGLRAMKSFLLLMPTEQCRIWNPLGFHAKEHLKDVVEDLTRTSRLFFLRLQAIKEEDVGTQSAVSVRVPVPARQSVPPSAAPVFTTRAADPASAVIQPLQPHISSLVQSLATTKTKMDDRAMLRRLETRLAPDPNQSVPLPPPQPRLGHQPLMFDEKKHDYLTKISQEPVGRVRRYSFLLRCLCFNPERHGHKVNLSKSKLAGVTASDPQMAENAALGALRFTWASWDEDPKKYESPLKEFLELIGRMKAEFGKTFPKAVNAIWVADVSSDPVDLTLLTK